MNIPKPDKKTILRVAAILLIALAVFFAGRISGGSDSSHDGYSAVEYSDTKAKITTWTCSMHPQIKLLKPGKCPICAMDLIPLEPDSDDKGNLRELSVSKYSAALMDIETVAAELRFISTKVRMVGKVDYDETRVSYITSWIPGRLDRLFVDYTGVPVRKGDHMVSLYSPELLSAQEELLQAIKAVKELKNSDIDIARSTTQATVSAAREKLRLWGLTSSQISEIEKREKPEDHVTIYAPASGIVIHKNAQEGMYVKTGTRIYTIADLSQVWVNLDAYESDLAWLRYGQQVSFSTEAYPGELFNGTISFINPVLNETTRTVKVRVNVPNKDGRLKPGMFIRAIAESKIATGARVMDPAMAGKWICPMHGEIVKAEAGSCDICGMPLVRTESMGYVSADISEEDKPLVIPASAVLLTGTRAIVYVKVPNKDKPTFEGREVVLGSRAGDYYIVKHGLRVGEQVVTSGAFKLDAELQIQAKPSMMTPGGNGGGGMAGMDHGEKKVKTEDMQTMTSLQLKLSPVSKSQLEDVADAADIAIAAGTDPATARKAYAVLKSALTKVNTNQLKSKAASQWKEYLMLLSNDAFEGINLKTEQQATALSALTSEHIVAMRNALGIESGIRSIRGSHDMVAVTPIPPAFKQQLSAVINAYLEIQSALAGDDKAAASSAATKALTALANVDMTIVSGDKHILWMKDFTELKTRFKAVAQADTIESARSAFAILSEQVASTISHFGVPAEKLYKAWCPMAFDNQGAFWIQNKESISNPYFGNAMIECGEIKEVLK